MTARTFAPAPIQKTGMISSIWDGEDFGNPLTSGIAGNGMP